MMDKIKLPNSDFLYKFFLLSASFIIFPIAFVLITSSLLFFVNVTISKFHLPFSLLMGSFIIFFLSKKLFEKHFFKVFFVLVIFNLLLFFGFLKFAGHFFDVSTDGQSYHQEAIYQLANGWNPVKKDLNTNDNPIEKNNIWINHYPKASWIFESSLYILTDNIEQSKVINYLLIISSFYVVFATLIITTKINNHIALVISLLISFNPVSSIQSLSFYIDGQLSSVLIIMVSLIWIFLFNYLKRREYLKKPLLMLLSVIVIILINMKFTAIAYSGIFLSMIPFVFLLNRDFKSFVKYSIYFVFLGMFAIAIIGYSPYVKNYKNNGHPLYPVYGKDAIDFITPNSPANFKDKNTFQKLVISTFSVTANNGFGQETKFKYPFITFPDEIDNLIIPDNRIAGLGPLFSGLLIISIVMLIYMFTKNKQISLISALCALTLFVSVAINPEGWWARYVPQYFLVPFTILIGSFFIESKLLRFFAFSFFTFAFINIYLILNVYIAFNDSATLRTFQTLESLKKRSTIKVYLGDYYSNRIKLTKKDIKFETVEKIEDLPCKTPIQLTHSPFFCEN